MYNTSLESDIKIMSQYQITAEENLFIKLLFYVQEHERESFDIFLIPAIKVIIAKPVRRHTSMPIIVFKATFRLVSQPTASKPIF